MSGDMLYEIFIRPRAGLAHRHVGSLRAPDAATALLNARDCFTRRREGESVWAVPAKCIAASSPRDKEAMFSPADDKVYRHPDFYDVPDEVEHM